jgi:small subunit ribosomal protein S4
MITIKNSRYKPIYKKFVNLKKNIQFRQKLLKFKKYKWKKLLFFISRFSKKRKKFCYYQFFDQNSYYIPKFNVYFTNKFKYNLQAKQRFNFFYGGLSKNYLKLILKKNLDTKFFLLLVILEKRLDTILYRSYFVLSMRSARQLISHGHVFVNGKIVNCKSYLIKKGDIISFSVNCHNRIEYSLGNSEIWPLVPKYLQINYKTFQIIIVENISFVNNAMNFPLNLDLNKVIQHLK